jgi:RNA polymerase sigma factor (sigma-70 family)
MTTRLAATLRRLVADDRPDGALLAGFLADRDEAAFAELVRRHGPLVWGVCRRLLPDPADAEDAFQAAFLVLVRRASRLSGRSPLGPWLYSVAVYTARNLRRRNARRFARQTILSDETPDHRPGPDAGDLAADLDAALFALPEKYRAPLVLCHLQGCSRRDAAERLRLPEGTLSSLLSRGLAKLRDRLAGQHPAAMVATAAVPTVLASNTVRAAAVAQLATAGVVSASVVQLAEGVLHMFWVKKATAATIALVAVFGFGVGIGVSVHQTATATAASPQEKPRKPAANPAAPAPVADLQTMKRRLAEVELARLAAAEAVEAAQIKLKQAEAALAKGKGPADQVAAAADAYAKATRNLARVEAESEAVARQLRQEEVTRPAGPQPQGPPPANPAAAKPQGGADPLADMKREMDKARALVDESAARVAAAQMQLDHYKQHLSVLEQQHKAEARMLEFKRAMEAARRKPGDELAIETGKAAVEVVVGAKEVWWPCWVKETGPDGKPVGSVICDNTTILAKYLTRVAKDPTAPKEVRILVSKDAPADRVQEVAKVCQAAGFQTVRLSGTGDAPSKRWTELDDLKRTDLLEFRRADVELLDATRLKEKLERERLDLLRTEQLKKYELEREQLLKEAQDLRDKLREKPKLAPEVQRLEDSLAQLSLKEKDLLKSVGPDHPQLRKVRDEIAELRKQLEMRREPVPKP